MIMGKPIIKHSEIRDVQFGENVVVVEPVNLYESKFCDNGFNVPFVEIQKDVEIGSNCKIQSHSFVCELVTIGNNCFIGHGVVFINDKMKTGPANGDRSKWKKTIIGDNVFIGSNATILPIEICNDVIIGAGAVVTKNITEAGTYAGNPARKIEHK